MQNCAMQDGGFKTKTVVRRSMMQDRVSVLFAQRNAMQDRSSARVQLRGGVQCKMGKNSRAKECDARQGFSMSTVARSGFSMSRAEEYDTS